MELRPEVRKFAELMERELRHNDWKPGWKGESELYLVQRLLQETAELVAVLRKGGDLGAEAADVANYAMMIADVSGWLAI